MLEGLHLELIADSGMPCNAPNMAIRKQIAEADETRSL
jgi:hypothetical protein